MRSLAAALCLLCFSAQAASADWIGSTGAAGAARDMIVRADWQYPWQLPPRFRNHCGFEYFTARPFCPNHCGSYYQFYFCSQASFGCCHLGRGYCDWSGLLRCSP
jgi:hypothetical protein